MKRPRPPSPAPTPPSKKARFDTPSEATTEIAFPPSPPKSDAAGPEESAFRFRDLSAELRVEVLKYLIPTGLTISFDARGEDKNGIVWRTIARTKEPANAHDTGRLRTFYPKFATALFLVDKQMLSEARGLLFSKNTFRFHVDGLAHHPTSLKSPEIFGAFGRPDRFHLLREIKDLEIDVNASTTGHWVTKRHRERLEYFVDMLREHAGDENQQSLLTNLTIRFDARRKNRSVYATSRGQPYTYGTEVSTKSQYMYGLESLAALRGIEKVVVEGLPPWYSRSLERCITGQGGDISPVNYPLEIKKRKITSPSGYNRYEMNAVTTRKWTQPFLNWHEFATRNGIELPSRNVIEQHF
ncbi:hypothetical protein BDV96DRAFT_655270 [Lophiotrema nucula]|uniref:Uncharacterized protein n=1 Tax=Lophiotrema nucula TaxID=690887 RepID=A0A6A5YF86_9PLEO|nr:hypothetical protein BDV96DRAFT_655270 [Lophiotrema nucula]